MLYPPLDGYCPDVWEGYDATLADLYSVFQDVLFWATFLVGECSRTSSLNFCDLICRKCDRVLEAIKVFRNSSISTFFSQKSSANFYKKEIKNIITRTCMTPWSQSFWIYMSLQTVLITTKVSLIPDHGMWGVLHLWSSWIGNFFIAEGERGATVTVRLGTYSDKSSASCMSDIQCQAFIRGL